MDALMEQIAGRPGWASALFEEDFDTPGPSDPEVIAPLAAPLAQSDIEAARAEGIAEGRAAARAEAEVAAETLAEAARALIGELATLRDAMHAEAEENATAIARLLIDTLGVLFPALCARNGATEARAVVRALLPGLRQEPEVVIRVAPALVEAISRELAGAEQGDTPRLRVTADPSLPAGDVRVQWQGGAATRDAAALWEAVASALASSGFLSAPIRETAHVE